MGIAGCRWYLPINGSTNSNAAGQATGQVGTSEMQKVAGACIVWASNSYPSLANQDRRIYGAVKKRDFSWKFTIWICERSCCLFSGDQSLISSFMSICLCGWSARFFKQGVHLHRRSVLDQLRHYRGNT